MKQNVPLRGQRTSGEVVLVLLMAVIALVALEVQLRHEVPQTEAKHVSTVIFCEAVRLKTRAKARATRVRRVIG